LFVLGRMLNNNNTWAAVVSNVVLKKNITIKKKWFFKPFFFSSTYTQWQCVFSYDNITAMYKFLKTLHLGGIWTRDILLCRWTRWTLCHSAWASFSQFVKLQFCIEFALTYL
jgi:hypothetical protein